MKNVVKLFKEAQEKKFFGNGEHVDLVNKDIDTILKYIDYDYANKVIAGGKDGLFNDRNDESGMPKRTDMLELLNDVIIDDEKLEYAKTEFKKVYDDQESINLLLIVHKVVAKQDLPMIAILANAQFL